VLVQRTVLRRLARSEQSSRHWSGTGRGLCKTSFTAGKGWGVWADRIGGHGGRGVREGSRERERERERALKGRFPDWARSPLQSTAATLSTAHWLFLVIKHTVGSV
jgi:hypothetical protein